MATRYRKLVLVLLATLMLVMIGCSSESEADKAAQNLIEITEESSDLSKIIEAGNKLSIELIKLPPSEQKAWKKKWDKKFEEASFDIDI